MKARIEIENPLTGLKLEGNSVKELKDVFIDSNVVKFFIITDEYPISTEEIKRLKVGTPEFNFVFDFTPQNKENEIEVMKKRIRGLQKAAPNWFDKRTRAYKYAYSFPNGFNTPLIFEEI